MSEPNPYADDAYKWGPPQQPGHQPTVADGQAYGYPNPGAAPAYGYPQPLPESATQPGPGYGYPHGQPTMPGQYLPVPQGVPGQGGGVPVLSIGDITVMNDAIVTPSGSMPLKGAVWTATDMSRTEEKIPAHAIVLAIIFALFCLIGLLFLLMKEKRTTGFVQVTVTSGGRHHSTMIPAMGPHTFPAIMGQLNQARSMSI
ncbi:hypothetical protein C6W96_22590 [Streptomyces sp. CS149]|uniref:hypothetical protein n=1 Tax=Streptomyces TaxID=1883 RepID=UPI000804A23D|nr:MULTISPECIES: hypothetical protein [unclassified Streptomyces]MCC8478636.1 hypothetical protein [Streptomyces globisporus]NUV66652.1 hypothetical protein [Streptomyces sp. CAI-121]NUV98393.1 hypothetical protein [Streptomyces sp. CAI 127]NUW11666.1 hypothetical protein [Streptomyces sp. CAI-68]PSK70472.1 hypothetical protein C6W96_22590 [Streptomyces sp. CS149]